MPLNSEMIIPLKVITTRLNHMKINLPKLMVEVEKRALLNHGKRKDRSEDINLLLTWDDWIYSALDANHKRKMNIKAKEGNNAGGIGIVHPILRDTSQGKLMGLMGGEIGKNSGVYEEALTKIMGGFGVSAKKPNWAENMKLGDSIPKELLDELPVTTAELVALGSWMLTKSIYRFEDVVIKEVLKSEFNGKLPSYIVNLPDICTYIQTDNGELFFEGTQVVGVIFCVTELCAQKVLVTTMYLDTGLPRTIVITLHDEQDIETSLTDFIDEFQYDCNKSELSSEIEDRLRIQKKLINLVLWFSQKKPELIPLMKENHKEKKGFKEIKREKRLFEAEKYKPFLVGVETAKTFNDIYENLENAKKEAIKTGRTPHLRKSHWHLYWYGKKGANERYELKLLPITMVGGIPITTT